MKRWAWMVAALYVALLMLLTLPAILLALGTSWKEATDAFTTWGYWVWLGVMFVSQLALLAVPVRVASRRPVSRGPVWQTILGGGLMAGGLAGGAYSSLWEVVHRQIPDDAGPLWTLLELVLLGWCVWTLIFARVSRAAPADLVARQCRWLLGGSILELLIAVPTHVVARHRGYCCAGVMTFIGLTMGFSVMLFAFGPALYFLFVERWRRLHSSGRGGASRNFTGTPETGRGI